MKKKTPSRRKTSAPRKPTGVFRRGLTVHLRTKIEFTTTYRALRVPTEQTQAMLDHHREQLEAHGVTSGIHLTEYGVPTSRGDVPITIATDLSKHTTFVGLSSDFS